METFEKELCNLLNSLSMENESNTPDFILARYLTNCLKTFNATTCERSAWYIVEETPIEPTTCEEMLSGFQIRHISKKENDNS